MKNVTLAIPEGMKRLASAQEGAALLEFTVVVGVLLSILFGVIEFSLAYYQWNAATKAMQAGARMASVSAPVWEELDTLRGDENNDSPGEALDLTQTSTFGYSVTCVGAGGGSCSFNGGGWGNANGNPGTTYNSVAMDRIVFGRGGGNVPATDCGNGGTGGLSAFGMCDIFSRIRPDNVRITYEHTNLGYATRPGGVTPTIRIELVGLTFDFLFLRGFTALTSIPIPGLTTTVSGEDLCSKKPIFPKWDRPGPDPCY